MRDGACVAVDASYYDQRTGTLHLVCPVVPAEVVVTRPDKRDRKVYTARVYRFVPKREEETWERSSAV